MTIILLCVLAAALMPVACAGIAKGGMFTTPRREGGFDNHAPREWLARQTGYRARANAAQGNCFEAMPFFIGAVAIALPLVGPTALLQALVIAWVLLRIAFVACYLADRASLRSVCWTLALAVNAVLLFSVLLR